MRKILFRGKSKIDGKWEYGLLNYSEQQNQYYIGTTELLTPVISESVGQFTALLDKSGKKIFEGDIVKATNRKENKQFIGDIRLPKSSWCLCVGKYVYRTSQYSKLEIIGNIHDNPELLQK